MEAFSVQVSNQEEFYFTFELAPHKPKLDYKVENKLHGQIMGMVHGTLRRHELDNVGISYPEWKASSEKRNITLGRRVIIFSRSFETLRDFRAILEVSEAEEMGVIIRSEIKRVPENVKRARFVRCRKKERMLRHKKDGTWRSKEDFKDRIGFHKPTVTVSSNGSKAKGFSIEIDQIQDFTDEGVFNTYGLSSTRSAPIF